MKFLFRKKYHQTAEQQGWNLVPDKSVNITPHSVRIIFDAGTGDGMRLAYFLQLFPYAIIHCFEPDLNSFESLEKRYSKHRRVILNRMALCGSSGLSQIGKTGAPCLAPIPIPDGAKLTLPEAQHLVRITVDDYCRVCRIDEIDLLRLPGTATEVSLYNGARIQLADKAIRSLLIPLKPGASEQEAAVTEIAVLNRGLERQGFALKGVRGARDDKDKFYGHMLYVMHHSL
jgi:FkbM family methyltransferase